MVVAPGLPGRQRLAAGRGLGAGELLAPAGATNDSTAASRPICTSRSTSPGRGPKPARHSRRSASRRPKPPWTSGAVVRAPFVGVAGGTGDPTGPAAASGAAATAAGAGWSGRIAPLAWGFAAGLAAGFFVAFLRAGVAQVLGAALASALRRAAAAVASGPDPADAAVRRGAADDLRAAGLRAAEDALREDGVLAGAQAEAGFLGLRLRRRATGRFSAPQGRSLPHAVAHRTSVQDQPRAASSATTVSRSRASSDAGTLRSGPSSTRARASRLASPVTISTIRREALR